MGGISEFRVFLLPLQHPETGLAVLTATKTPVLIFPEVIVLKGRQVLWAQREALLWAPL